MFGGQAPLPTATHRGGGSFIPMSTHGSASRVMTPPRRSTPIPNSSPGRRHGSAELGGNPGGGGGTPGSTGRADRERDRPSRDRRTPMGPQETMDWEDAVGSLTARIEAVERNQRQHAQNFASTHAAAEAMKSVAEELAVDYLLINIMFRVFKFDL